MFVMGINDTGDKLFTRVIDTNPCHRFSVIAGVIDTGDKFIGGVVDTGEQLSPGWSL
jgi:hypothetical protein